ncbi:MAG: hypothetical protein JNL70_10710 [Saprospiraceae bacterium]|nr:hypothetical protein [Saprospiraceae bacterium]
MKTNTQPIQPDYCYHIYNRGINGETLFKQERNYAFFLKQYAKFIEPIAKTYAYVLMNNHFHLLVKIKSEVQIRQAFPTKGKTTIEHLIGQQFAKLFSSYAQAINRQEKRTGGLFEECFRRKPVLTENYAAQAVYYIHHNPQKHQFVSDFRDYPYSSFRTFIQEGQTRIPREEVFDWFGGKKTFLAYHGMIQEFDEVWLQQHWIEL